MSHKILRLVTSLFLALAITFAGVTPARAAGPWYVTPTGDDSNACLSPAVPCATINGAIGKAVDGDTIKVATGTYTDTISYVVNINKSIALSGGWNAAFTTQNGATVIDGQNVRGGVYISNVGTTLDHFVIQNGYVNYGAGIYIYQSTVTINNSTVSENHSYGASYGGGINIESSTVTINNSTISGNTGNTLEGATQSGGIRLTSGSLTVQNSTIANNSGGYGGGLMINSGTLTLRNSILANNTASISGPDCFGSINTSDHNIISNTSSCTVTPGPGDQFNVDPLISAYPVGALAYHALLSGSPAIDAGDTCLSIDQRGVARPQGSACDIGSYEYTIPGAAASFGVTAGSNQSAAPGVAFAKPLVVNVLDSQGSPVDGETVNFTAPASGASGTFTNTGTNVTTAITDSSGLAVSSVFTANSQLGSYIVTATVAGLPGSASFALTNATWFVAPTGNDDNTCASAVAPCLTINAAINKAIAGDTIKVAIGTYNGTGSEVVFIDKSITLLGGWNTTFTAQSGMSTIDGQAAIRGITIIGGVTALIERFIVQNALSNGAGGIYNGGGLITLNASIVSGNTSVGGGGGISNVLGGALTLNASTVSGNTASIGGGIANTTASTMTINNSTVSSNTANSRAGGIYNAGGTLSINNTTIYGNSSTFSPGGGGIYNEKGSVILRNSILAGNTNTQNDGPDCLGTINSSGYNLIGDTSSCEFTPMTGDLTNLNPSLGPLQDNGGPTFTHALLSLSLAIDSGDPAGCIDQDGNLLTTDQRGFARPRGTRCDIGAYEYTDITTGPATSLAVLSGSGQLSQLNIAFPKPLRAVALNSQGNRVSGVTVTFTAPGSGASGTFADTSTNTTTVDTDAGGVATTSIFTANDQAGTYTVSASAPGLGSVDFSLEQIFRLANDNFANAEAITSLPFTATVDITDTTNEPGEQQICYSMDRTVWYSFTPTETMIVRTNTQGSAVSGNVNIYHALGSGISDLQFLNCSGPNDSPTFIAEANQTYYLQAGSAFGEVGSIQVNLEQIPSTVNDDFSNAVAISALPFSDTRDTSAGTSASDDPTDCSNNGSVWYQFTPPSDTPILANTFGSDYDTVLSVYTGSRGVLEQVPGGCNDDTDGLQSLVAFNATGGTTYYFMIGFCCGNGNAGGGNLIFSVEEGSPPSNEVAIDIKPGSQTNPINPKSTGKIPVAILSTADFNAPSEVDKASLTFGRTGDELSLISCNKKGVDVNGDGLLDLVCHFKTKLTGFQIGDTEGLLKGQTLEGVSIEGRDSVRILK